MDELLGVLLDVDAEDGLAEGSRSSLRVDGVLELLLVGQIVSQKMSGDERIAKLLR